MRDFRDALEASASDLVSSATYLMSSGHTIEVAFTFRAPSKNPPPMK